MEAFIKEIIRPPEYLERTTRGIVIVTLVLVIPFGIYSFMTERTVLLVACLGFFSLCVIYLWTCQQGKCNRAIVAYPVTPMMMFTFSQILYELGVVGVYWSISGSIALYFLLARTWAMIANVFYIGALISVAWTVLDIQLVTRFFAVLMGANVFSAIAVDVINKQHAQLQTRVVTDPLTGLYNRSLLQRSVAHATHQFHRTGTKMSVIMIDVDHFKRINDALGHDEGDRVLISCSELLKKSFRRTDMIFRIGGEEFLALVYNADKTEAAALAEKLRHDVEEHRFLPDRKVTVSVGVSEIAAEEDATQWLRRCDQNLYQAKRSGRNQVIA